MLTKPVVRGPRSALPGRTATRTEELQGSRIPARHRRLRQKASTNDMTLFPFPFHDPSMVNIESRSDTRVWSFPTAS